MRIILASYLLLASRSPSFFPVVQDSLPMPLFSQRASSIALRKYFNLNQYLLNRAISGLLCDIDLMFSESIQLVLKLIIPAR